MSVSPLLVYSHDTSPDSLTGNVFRFAVTISPPAPGGLATRFALKSKTKSALSSVRTLLRASARVSESRICWVLLSPSACAVAPADGAPVGIGIVTVERVLVGPPV